MEDNLITVYLALYDADCEIRMERHNTFDDDAGDDFWLADVTELESGRSWALDLPPMGDTPGDCLDAVIRESKR